VPSGILFIVVLIAIMWLLLIRPQRQRQVKQQQMLSALNVDDEIVTAGGIYGTIVALDDDVVHVRVAPDVTLRLARRAIAAVVHDEDTAAEPEVEEATDGEPESPERAPG
jgi:preprotein translocase subunit YajC